MYPVKRPRRTWIKVTGILAAAVLLLAGCVLLGLWEFSLSLEHSGEDELVIGYGESCPEPDARVILRGAHILRDGLPAGIPVQTQGTVDADTVGTYTVTYSWSLLWWSFSDSRVVRVVDTIPPEITLISDPDHITAQGEAYTEEGYRAWDEYDGDLTDRVIRQEKDGVVTYLVTDSSGNRAVATRRINYGDIRSPEITLTGGSVMTLSIGARFDDPGFSAWDDTEGDVTAQVAVSGTVDIYTAGTYTLTYTVSDSRGNRAEAVRTVEITPADRPEQQVPQGKVIYLTFDDGPSVHTARLLEILAKYDVKATFFVVGCNDAMMARIVEEGHAIGIHSVTHSYRQIYASQEAYFADLRRMRENIYNATGVWTTLVRFPGGSSNTVSCFNEGIMTTLTQSLEDQGFQYFDWNVDSNDAGGAKDSTTVFNNVVMGVQRQNVSIVLQHDTQSFSVEAVEDIIRWGLANGYTFLPLEPSSPNCHHGVNN